MKKRGKKYQHINKKIDRARLYTPEEGFKVLCESKAANFDETVETAYRLGVDPRKAEQMVRGTTVLPHGLGKPVRIVVFAKGEKEQEAKSAGADEVGSDDLIKKIQDGWMEFDRAVATRDMMGAVSKLGKILGPRGLMPNPKSGTVTDDVAKAVEELRKGRVEFRVDKTGIVHCSIGKFSFGEKKLLENFIALTETILRAKPDSAKGTYIKTVAISTTMGPGIKLDPQSLRDMQSAA